MIQREGMKDPFHQTARLKTTREVKDKGKFMARKGRKKERVFKIER